MKKKVKLLFAFLIAMQSIIIAQPTINNCENFSIGTTLKFLNCNSSGVVAGPSGANQTWNFSNLSSLSDTITEWMVSPSSTPHGNLFPTANLVEKYSDGTYVYAILLSGSNQLTGYLDTVNNYTIHYPNPSLFAVRPITFGNIFTDTSTVSFTSPSMTSTGMGITIIDADGYGTLILPNGTFNNVLRLKITQIQYDTITSSGSPYTSATISYVWFDGIHTSGLLKIDSTSSGSYNTKTVEYLIDEITGINNIKTQPQFKFYPNPVSDQINIFAPEKGTISITDVLGKIIENFSINENKSIISTENLTSGIYFISYQALKFREVMKLIIRH